MLKYYFIPLIKQNSSNYVCYGMHFALYGYLGCFFSMSCVCMNNLREVWHISLVVMEACVMSLGNGNIKRRGGD